MTGTPGAPRTLSREALRLRVNCHADVRILVSALPLIILAVLVLGMLFFAQRNRQKAAAAEVQRRATIGVGTDVMTTAGLYGTVTAINEDGRHRPAVHCARCRGEVRLCRIARHGVAAQASTGPAQLPVLRARQPTRHGATPTEPDDARPDRPAPERPDA